MKSEMGGWASTFGRITMTIAAIALITSCTTTQTKLVPGKWVSLNAWSPNEEADPANRIFEGRTLAIAEFGHDLYIGTAGGGVWKSTNAGETWASLTDHVATQSASSIVIDPLNPKIIYVGTGEAGPTNGYPDADYGNGILKTTDGGKTWTAFGNSTFHHESIRSLYLNPKDDRVLYAATDTGIFESSDAGIHWIERLSPKGGEVTAFTMTVTSSLTLYAAISQHGVELSHDSGKTWTPLAVGKPEDGDVYVSSIAVSPSDSNTMYVVCKHLKQTSDSGMYVTMDGGKSWTHKTSALAQLGYAGWEGARLSVDPNNSKHILIWGILAEQSTDAGSTWTAMNLPHADIHKILFAKGGTFIAATDGGVFQTTDGITWVDINNNLDTLQFYPGATVLKNGAILCGTQDNGALKYKNGQWSFFQGGDGLYTAQDRHEDVYVGMLPSQIVRNGYMEGEIHIPSPKQDFQLINPFIVSPIDGTTLIVGSDRVYRVSGFSKFTPISPKWYGDFSSGRVIYDHHKKSHLEDMVTAVAQSSTDGNTLYAGTYLGHVYNTSDGGKEWRDISPIGADKNAQVDQIVVDSSNPNKIWVVYGGGTVWPGFAAPESNNHVYYNSDVSKSNNWRNLTGNLPDSPVNAILVLRNHVLVGTNQGVFISAPGSSTWNQYGQDLPDVEITNLLEDGSNLIVGTNGRGMWETTLPN